MGSKSIESLYDLENKTLNDIVVNLSVLGGLVVQEGNFAFRFSLRSADNSQCPEYRRYKIRKGHFTMTLLPISSNKNLYFNKLIFPFLIYRLLFTHSTFK